MKALSLDLTHDKLLYIYINPPHTLVLMSGFTGTTSTDVDLNDDGILDNIGTFGTVLDAVGVRADATTMDYIYASQLTN